MKNVTWWEESISIGSSTHKSEKGERNKRKPFRA
jgi:hypothetical protein